MSTHSTSSSLQQHRDHQVCSRCLCDDTFPNIRFGEQGECNLCHLHDLLDKRFPCGNEGRAIIERTVESIRRRNRDKEFDCIVGVSGGRDSTYTMYLLKQLGLRPLAVHFNDGFGNPIAGENMTRASKKLGIPLRIITSDWRESKDIRLSILKASIPEMGLGTDLGLAAALYGAAAKEGVQDVIIGISFRTEGMAPLRWNYLDGTYLNSIQSQFGSVPLRGWKPEDPGFNLGIPQMLYYVLYKRIRTFPILYFWDYVRADVDKIISAELGWENPGAHYFDDLWQSVVNYTYRKKFHIDRRKFNWSALVRSGQMDRNDALERIRTTFNFEDPKLVELCIKRLGLSREEFEAYVALPPRYFTDYSTQYDLIRAFKWPITLLSKMNLLPVATVAKYYET